MSAMHRALVFALAAAALPHATMAQGPTRLSAPDEAAVFRAAGFIRSDGRWKNCRDGSDSPSYEPGRLDTVRDLDGDGRPDAVIVEGGAMCYGMAGQMFWVVSKQADGRWRVVTSAIGYPTFLPRRTAAGWPDLEIGGPGFCFPVQRWNGRVYVTYRYQYESKPCRRPN